MQLLPKIIIFKTYYTGICTVVAINKEQTVNKELHTTSTID